ncbi:MAG: hypothetical protein HY343_07505 [Lentisphaerae bacterium]|nr:hypothetical protein [Lentisphaerota bacterium]
MVNVSDGKRWIWLVGIAAVAVLAVLWLKPNDESRIRRAFAAIADMGAKSADENLVAMALKTKSVESFLATPCALSVPRAMLDGAYTPQQLVAACIQAKGLFRTCALSFHDLRIEFPEKDTARVVFTARLTGTLNSGESVNEAQEVEATLVKDGKAKWIFRSLTAVETLKK